MQVKVYNTEKVSAFPREPRLHKMSLADATKYKEEEITLISNNYYYHVLLTQR